MALSAMVFDDKFDAAVTLPTLVDVHRIGVTNGRVPRALWSAAASDVI